MSHLTDFTRFPLLPLELRRKIWLWTLPRPRVLSCCWAVPEPVALQINSEAREVALKHFELIPKHTSTRRGDRHCIGHTHLCSYGYIDFNEDYLARQRRIRHQCIDKTTLGTKTQNLHTEDFDWIWAVDSSQFNAHRWVTRNLLLNYKSPVRRVLVVIHQEKIREITLDQRGLIDEQLSSIKEVMIAGLTELKILKDVEGGPKWKIWIVPEIEFRRCPCCWEEGPIHYRLVCRANFGVGERFPIEDVGY